MAHPQHSSRSVGVQPAVVNVTKTKNRPLRRPFVFSHYLLPTFYLRHIGGACLATPRARPSLSRLARGVLATITLIHSI